MGNEKWLENARERKKEEEENKKNSTSSGEDWLDRARDRKHNEEVQKVDSSYINLFVDSANSFFNSAEDEYNKVSWGNASQSYQNRNNTYQDLQRRSNVIREWLNSNKDSLDADAYAEMAEYLDYFGTNATSILDSFAQAKEYYGQWATEADYNAYAAYKKDYDEKASLDLDAAAKEIEELERRREELEASRQQPASNYLNGSYMLTNQPYAAAQQAPQASPQEQELYELKQLITQKQQYLNLAKRIQESIALSGAVNNADFDQYNDYVSTESDGGWSKLTSQYGMGYGDLTYEYINGKDSGIRGEIIRKASIYSNKGAMGALDKWTSYNYMDENEIAIYNYYYAKDGKEAAEKYLNSIQDSLNQRAGSAMAGAMDDNTLLELAFGVAAGMDQFESGMEGAWQAITGNADYIPVSSTQYASQMVREDLADAGPKLPEWLGGASLGQVGYDTITTGTNMAPSILASVAIGALNPMAGAAVGKGLMGTSAAGNAYQQKLNDGYSQDQARAYGVMVGASEVLLESLLGGISKMGGGLLPDTIIKNLNSVDNAFAKFATSTGGKLLIKSGSEAIEEGLQEVIEPYLWQAVSGEEASVNFEEALYSALLGFVTGGMFEGGDMMLNTAAQNSQYRADGRTIKGAEGGVDALMALANEVAGATTGGIQKDLAKQTSKVESRASNKNVGRLYDTVQKANDQANAPANQADIAKSLERKGFSSETANDIAAALVASYNGQELTSTQQRLLKSASKNSAVQDAISNIMVNSKSTMGQRSQKIRDFQQNILGDTSRTNPAQQSEANASASVKVDAQNENGVESHYEVSADGKTIDSGGNIVAIKGISSIENGRMVLETEDGGTINASEVTYGNRSEALVYEAVANLEGIIDTGTANKLSKHLMKLGGASSNVYVNGIVQAYTYGYYGYGREAMTGKDTLSRTLTEKQRNVAYGLGQQYRDMKTAADQANVRNATVDKKNATVGKKNATAPDGTEYKKVRFEGEIKKWSEKQKAEVEFIDFIASNFSGNTVRVYESYKGEDGKYYYKDSSGKVHVAPNGIYFGSTGDIYLDLNAGTHGEGLILNTFAHELYHHIQKRSPAKARALAEFLVKELGYESVEAAVNRQIAKAERTGYGVAFFMNEKGMSRSAAERTVYDRAFSDFVADSLETMFTKGDAVSKLQKLKQQDNTLFNWIKGFIDKWVTKLREFYSNHSAISIEGRQVASLEKFEQIQQMFMEALVDAGENYLAAEVQKNTTEDGGVEEFSIRRTQKMTLKEQLSAYYHKKFKLSDSFYFGMTPSILSRSGLDANPLAFGQDDFAKSTRNKHNIPRRVLNKLNENLAKPIFSFTAGKQAAIVIDDIDGDGKQVVVAIHGNHNMDRKPVSLIKSIYGIDSMEEWVTKQINGGSKFRVYDIEKANAMLQTHGYLAEVGTQSDGFWDIITPNGPTVNNESIETLVDAGIAVDSETDAGAIFSVRDVLDDTDRKKVAKALMERFDVTEKEAMEWLKAETSLASLILNPKYSMFLDYEGDPNEVAIKQNSDYPQGTVDFSNICKKRREFTQVMNRVLRNFPNHVFAATDLAKIRTIMGEEGMTLPCGICYVEDRRQLDTIVAQDFINGLKLYREGSKTRPDGKPFNANQLKGLQLTDGDTYVPTIYELVSLEGRNSLKAKNPNMEAAWVKYNNARGMQSVRLLTNEAEYKRQILKYSKKTVQSKNDHGGLRIYSFSDAEMFHLIDIIQVITDSAAVGLTLQGYTKVNEYAKAVKDTGEKLNRSLIPLGELGYHIENGKVVLDYDTVEGIDIHSKDFFDNKDNPDVGNITIGINDIQIRAAMVSDFVDQIIPFHTGQSEEVLGEKGIAAWKNYKDFQTEKDIATGKTSAHQVNIYTEVFQAAEKEGKPIRNKRQFVEKFLQVCNENGLQPRFSDFLNTDAQGNYIYTEGYHKFLVDFKTFAQTEVGEYLPQKPVKPIFDNAYITGLLKDYVKEQQVKDAEVAKQMPKVIERITNEIIKADEEVGQFSDRDYAPAFYSQMAKVVDGMKQEKFGAASVVSMLRGRGVKAEEIKWSGIEEWLAGKKSVTKAELQEFIAGSMLQIEEDTLGDQEIPYSQEHLDLIAKYEAERDIIAENLKSEWKRIVGTDIPITYFGAGLESAVVNNLLAANAEKKGNTEVGYKYKAKRAALQRVIEDSDHYFGFDNARQAFREALRDPKDFLKSYEMTSFEEGVFKDFIKAKEAYSKVEGISLQDQRTLKSIAESADRFSSRILKVKTEHRTEAAKYLSKYRNYTVKGGTNYRELLFRIPGSTYSNGAMDVHWERAGVLAHARMQDLNTFLGKMLFVEEIQSDWHNEGHKSGYTSESDSINAVPDAPFKDNYHEFVLKRLIRMAAEQDYDSIGWTTADIQSKRWSDEFAEGYRIEYDQDIPKFLNKYGKKWGTRVGKTALDNGTEVWSMAITDEMKDSVLTEGQPMYSERDTESVSNRSLLANALEGAAQNDIERNRLQEYKGKISLIEAEERKLGELTQKIRDLSFAKGPKDTKAIRDLQFEATQTANRISTYDKQLLRLEASKPLQNVLDREKKMAYQRAEKKGKDALAAYREKSAKTQRELLDRWQESRKKGIESREKTAMRHKIKDVVNELNQYLLHGNKDKRVMMSLKKAVAEALDAVNMDTVGAEERIAKLEAEMMKAKTPEAVQEISRKIDHIREMGDRMSNRLKSLKDAYREIAESDDPLIANAHDDVIEAKLESVIENVGNTALRDMNLAQLEEVYDMYRMVLTTIRNSNKAFKAAKSESIAVLGNRVMEEVEKVGGKKKYSVAALESIKKFGWNNLKPVYAFAHIGSDTFTEVFNNVRKGEDVWALDVSEAREFYLDKAKKFKYDSWDLQKQYRFKSTSGMDFNLNLEQIMSLYAYSKRDQAADHLKRGGIVIDESTEITMKTKMGFKVKFNPTEATAYNISEETLAEITGKLTDDQKGYVDEMQDYLSTVMGAKGNEVSLELYGIKLFKEKFYFPLKSASQFMAKAKEQQQGEVKIKNSGFSKETVKKASNPIVLTPFMNVWANHVNEMSMYHAFVLPMEDFYRVYNYRTPTSDTMATESVEMFIQNAYGKGATRYIDQLLKDLNGGARTDSTTGFINKMMGLFKKGAVFASLSVVVQQPSAIARAAALVNLKYFIGPKVDHKRHKMLWKEVKQYAPVAIIKEMGYFDTNMGKSTQDFILGKEYSGFGEKMKALFTDSNYRDEALSKAPALADEIAWCGIWEAVKRETQAKYPGLDVKSEPFLMLAGSRFTEVITKTQVYDSVLSRSANMRSKDTGMKMVTAFMAEPTTSINMVADALLQGKRGNRKYARGAIGAVVASQILNSILVSFVYAGRDDDEDKTYWEKYIGTLTGQTLDSLNPAGYIPFIKDIVSIVQGYDVERSDMAVVSDLWKAWQNLSKDTVSTYRKVEGFAGSIAQIFGLPVKNIMRDARGIYQTVMSFVEGQQTTKAGIGYAVKENIPKWLGGGDVSNQEQLYEATLSGDKEHLARVQSRYADEDAVEAAMRTAIKEHYLSGDIDLATAQKYLVLYGGKDGSEAHWLTEEWTFEAGSDEEFQKYNEFYEAVKTGKNLKAVIKEYTDNGVEMKTLSSQITSHFKPLYIEMSNAEKANIKGYLLNAMTVLGDTREEAEMDIRKWEFEGKYGFAYSDFKQEFIAGNISTSDAKSAIMRVEGKTVEDAEARVDQWQYEADYPELVGRITYTQYKRWETDGKPNGVSIELFTDVAEFRDDETSSETKSQEEVAAYINSLPISTAQKDALWCCFWKASTLKKAPWR